MKNSNLDGFLWEISRRLNLNNKNIDFYKVSRYYRLSENIIEKYKDKVEWREISIYQDLSEKFLEKHKNKVDFVALFNYREGFSKYFCRKYDKSYVFLRVYGRLFFRKKYILY